MRQSLKVALSLLISVVLFCGFAVLAYFGLFGEIQDRFFSPRAAQQVGEALEAAAHEIAVYHGARADGLRALAADPSVAAVFQPVPPAAERARRQALAAELAAFTDRVKDLVAGRAPSTVIRLLSTDGALIHFSTRVEDERENDGSSVYYRRISEVEPEEFLELLQRPLAQALLFDPARSRYVYRSTVAGGDGTAAGIAVLTVETSELAARLTGLGLPRITGGTAFADGEIVGMVVGQTPAERAAAVLALQGRWASFLGSQPLPATFTLASSAPGGEAAPVEVAYRAYGRSIAPYGVVSLLVPEAEFQMGLELKVLLSAVFFVTSFLLIYLLFNMRPDPLEVVSQRVKRFQVQLLEGMLGRETAVDWGRWHAELERRRPELTRQLQRGIGRVSRRQQPALDAYIDKSWNEILELMAARIPAASPPSVDLSRLESLIQQALKSASFVVPAQIIGGRGQPASAGGDRAPRRSPMQVEELSAEDVEDLEEAEAAGEVPPVPVGPGQAGRVPVEESAAGVEELEAVEESAEAAPTPSEPATAEAREVEGVEAAGGSEAIEDAEAVEEAEEAEIVEGVEGVREPVTEQAAAKRRRGASEAEPAEGQVPEEVEELPAAEVEEEPSEGGVDASPPSPAARSTPSEAGLKPVEDLGPIAVPAEPPTTLPKGTVFEEALDELEPLQELVALPPLPEEEGLELLPSADKRRSPARPPAAVDLEETEGIDLVSRPAAADESAIEELEALEEAPEAVTEEWSEADQRSELSRLAAEGGIRTWTIEQLQEIAEETRTAIVLEDGVYRIREEVYAAAPPTDQRAPAASQRPTAAEPEGSLSGIVDLIRESEGIDLAKVLGGDREPTAETAPLSTDKAKVMRLKRAGLDYDEFLAGYPRSFSHTTQMKSLVELSRRATAVGAALLLKGAEGWAPDLTVGLAERTVAGLKTRAAEPLASQFFTKRIAVSFDKPPGEIRTLRARFDTEDLKFCRRLLFLPAIFRGQEAYLLLAFTSENDVSLENVFPALQVQ